MSTKVLVVDDEKEIRELIQEVLEGEGYTVFIADDGTSGLEKAKAEVPNLIISDLMMTQMNGGVMAARLKEDTRTSNIPIIYLTAVVSDEEAELTDHRLAGERLLSKPFGTDELLTMVQSVLGEE